MTNALIAGTKTSALSYRKYELDILEQRKQGGGL